MVRYKIHYKSPPSPREQTVRLILVPVILAVLALGGCVASHLESKEPAWNSPRTVPVEAPLLPQPAMHAKLQVTTAPARSSETGPPVSGPTKLPAPKHEPQPTGQSPKTLPKTGASTSPGSTGSGDSQAPDQQEQGNFSPRTAPASGSIQLTPCQRSAAACFASGGLDTLMDNLDGLTIDPVTGRFCFSFQEGCRR